MRGRMSVGELVPTDEQPVLLLSLAEIRDKIERMPLSADAKAILSDIAVVTLDVGGVLIAAGRKILSFVFDLVQRFPNTAFGALAASVVSALIASVPLFGVVLGPLLAPLLLALGLAAGALTDLKERAVAARFERLEKEFLALSAPR